MVASHFSPFCCSSWALLPFSLSSSCCSLLHFLPTFPYTTPLKKLSMLYSKNLDSMTTVWVITVHRSYRDHSYHHHSMILAVMALHQLPKIAKAKLKVFLRENRDGYLEEGAAIIGWTRHMGAVCSYPPHSTHLYLCSWAMQHRVFCFVMDVFRHPSEGGSHMTWTPGELGMRKGAG